MTHPPSSLSLVDLPGFVKKCESIAAEPVKLPIHPTWFALIVSHVAAFVCGISLVELALTVSGQW